MSDIELVVREVARFCALHGQRESAFLSPDPNWTVDPHDLLAHLSQTFNISKRDIGGWVDEECKRSAGCPHGFIKSVCPKCHGAP